MKHILSGIPPDDSAGQFTQSPIYIDRPDDFDKLSIVNRLYHITGNAQPEAVHFVLFFFRRRQDHYRYHFQLIIVLHYFKKFNSVHFGHIKIQKNDTGCFIAFVP